MCARARPITVLMRSVPGLRLRLTAFAATLVAVLSPAAGASAQTPSPCSRVASPSGSDAAAGSETAPFRTAQKLVDSLSAGHVGCLRAGSYSQSVRLSRGGTGGAPLTLRSYPGEEATLSGRLTIAASADWVTVEELYLDGRNAAGLPSPTVNADDVVFRNNDVTNQNSAICFLLGSSTSGGPAGYGRARRPKIISNRIHNCGRLPATNHDHGIYVEGADDAVISGNWIYDNADRGIQLYPDAHGTEVTGNVLDANGTNLIFSGDDGLASSDNTVHGNVLSRSVLRFNVESWWPDGGPRGQNNHFTSNCVYGAARTEHGTAGIDSSAGGFTATANTTAPPGYVDAAAKDFRLTAASACNSILGGYAATIPGPLTQRSSPGPGPDRAHPVSSTGGNSRRSSPPGNRLRIALRVLPTGPESSPRAPNVVVTGRMRGRHVNSPVVKLEVRTHHRWRTASRRRLRGRRLFARLRIPGGRRIAVRAAGAGTKSNVVIRP